ncbi:hypothetical protein SEA_BRUHMOMENT_101 [Arthrobacter phage BruhMoment]|nr:hypothetical protein SEA_BRUHMOMENT_101 [Arthrobacter phage BruhMoment]
MNEYEIDDIVEMFGRDKEEIPNLHAAALALSRLRGWTNCHSDGWQYWSKPSAAATQLVTLIKDGERQYRKTWEWQDCTEAQLTKALTPVKSFLTRHKEDWRSVLDPPPTPDPVREIQRRAWNEGFAADAGSTNPYA